jgi:VWFA-related protein
VTIGVSVYDQAGELVKDLKPSDFAIFIDGHEVSLDSVAQEKGPIHVLIGIDASGSVDKQISRIQDAAVKLIQSLGAGDQVLVVSFNENDHLESDFSTERDPLIGRIKKLKGEGGTRIYQTVTDLITKRLTIDDPRTAIVLLTDGVDTALRGRSTYESSLVQVERSAAIVFPIYFNTFNDSPHTSRLSGVMSGVSLPSVSGSTEFDYALGPHYLTDLVKLSGGWPILADKALQDISAIPVDVRERYYIRFNAPLSGRSGERHAISVRVNRPGLLVLAKGSFVES